MVEAVRIVDSLARPTWISAMHQTAARGRRGRPWVVPEGNLNATLIYRPQATPAEAAQRSFVASNALLKALAIYVPAEKLAQKWPNDVLLESQKVAGILLESSGSPEGVAWLSIGIGVNLKHVPQGVTEAHFPPTSLRAAGGWDVEASDFLVTLANAFAVEEATLIARGFGPIRETWLAHAARLGEVITAQAGQEQITGVFDGIDHDGNLVLTTASGARAIAAADVFF